MITIPRPSMALHSHDVPGFKYRLENNFTVPKTDPVDHLLGVVATYAQSRGRLAVLVINCHGETDPATHTYGGYGLWIGEGIRRCHTGKFTVLNGLVSNIIIAACGAARIHVAGTAGDGDGNLFCSEIAKAAGAYVIAATTSQLTEDWLPDDTLDDFEGLVLRYDPSGGVDCSHDYGRNLIDGLRFGWN